MLSVPGNRWNWIRHSKAFPVAFPVCPRNRKESQGNALKKKRCRTNANSLRLKEKPLL